MGLLLTLQLSSPFWPQEVWRLRPQYHLAASFMVPPHPPFGNETLFDLFQVVNGIARH